MLQACGVVISLVLLLIAALIKFNTPPTNKAGTTFFLFWMGCTIYYMLLVVIWMIATAMLQFGGMGLLSEHLNVRDLGWLSPVLAATLMLLGGWRAKIIKDLDERARRLCLRLAAVPSKAQSLAFELARLTPFDDGPKRRNAFLRPELQNRRIPVKRVLVNDRVGSMPAAIRAFVRAVLLRQQLTAARQARLSATNDGALGQRYRSYLARNKEKIDEAEKGYAEFMDWARKFFASPGFQDEKAGELQSRSEDVFARDCRLLAGAVLQCELTEARRRCKLAEFGFDRAPAGPSLAGDHLFALMALVMLALALIQLAAPPHAPARGSESPFFLIIRIGFDFGLAIFLGTAVAYRSLARDDAVQDPPSRFPPVATAVAAGSVTIAASLALRIVFCIAALVLNSTDNPIDWGRRLDFLAQNIHERWAYSLFPFFTTVSLALCCAWFPRRVAGLRHLALAGGAIVGLVLASVAPLVSSQTGGHQGWHLIVGAGIIGFAVGATVLPVFKVSLCSRQRPVARSRQRPVNDVRGDLDIARGPQAA